MALGLHYYQYHGPNLDMSLSKCRTREEAAKDIKLPIARPAKSADSLRQRAKRGAELEEALGALEKEPPTPQPP